jgi:hypothetical protein
VSGLADDEQEHGVEEHGVEEHGVEEDGDEDEPEAMPSVTDLMDALRQVKVGELLLSTVSTLASVAYGKLESRDFAEAKTAIEAIRALLPVLEGQVEDGIRRDFEQALTNLQLAYADAVASAQ